MRELADLLDQILGRPPWHAGDGLGSPVWRALQESQLCRVGLIESLGGAGGSRADAAQVIMRCAESGLSLPLTEAMIIGAALCERAGLPMPPGVIACLIPGAENQVAAHRDGDSWRLDGAAAGVAWAAAADAMLVLADISPATVAIAIVDPARVTFEPGCNLAREPRDAVQLDGVLVRPGQVAVLPRGSVADIAVLAALGRTCQLTGAARTCLALSIDQARLREQFGRSIDRYQVVRHALVEMIGELTATEAATSAAIELAVGSEPLGAQATLAVLIARVQASRAATQLSAIAHQVHGAVGLADEHALHHFTTRLWSWRDEYGTEHEWALALAAAGRQGGDLWASLTAPGEAMAAREPRATGAPA
jgi:acyl-CoA dehydrogenase